MHRMLRMQAWRVLREWHDVTIKIEDELGVGVKNVFSNTHTAHSCKSLNDHIDEHIHNHPLRPSRSPRTSAIRDIRVRSRRYPRFRVPQR